jgi:uncharacterized membrane protein
MTVDRSDNESLSSQMSVPHDEGFKIEKSVIVRRPAAELYQFWRNFENLPRFMNHLKSVSANGQRSHWVARGPLGKGVEWDAEIINEIPAEVIGWRSLDGADVPNAGSVHFKELNSSSGTEVRVVMKYSPPAGAVGALVAALFGENPEQQLNDDLSRFKEVMETGQVSSGAR